MSRIADKHGITNKYREVGIGKRVVKRGRARTTIFGSSKRRKAKAVSDAKQGKEEENK